MSDLTDFLLARIAEDEAMAHRIASYVEGDAVIQVRLYRSEKLPDGSERGASETVTPYHPKRALAECEAKRRIVEACSRVLDANMEAEEMNGDEIIFAQGVLADLALPFADHPDYREEWRA